ncbi:hypothetical protein HDU79_007291 [Rhizoclosmatium sp. JEL0117]|nr:hypothetical protein HDU79_007291 [Rhizoclosmatium sp. JEL0117]
MSGHATQYFDLREKELSFKTRQIDQVLSDPTEPTVSLLKTNYASNKATSKATYQSAKAYIEAVYQGSLKAAEETYLVE